MENIPDNNPPADQQYIDGFYNWEWFKQHHFDSLDKYYKLIEEQYAQLPLGKGYPQDEIVKLLHHLDELIKLYDCLPGSSGGQGTMNEVIKGRQKFEADYLNKDVNNLSFLEAQEIIFKVFTIHNYMKSMCEV